MNTKLTGNYGEECVAKHLRKNGYKIVERNYKTRFCEIDIIARKGNTLCFVEVKTRSSSEYGMACEAVDYRKRQKLIKGALHYLAGSESDFDLRFDVAEVYIREKGIFKNPVINIIENAFDAEGRGI